MKRILVFLLVVILFAFIGAAWVFLASDTAFDSPKKELYIHSNGTTKEAILDSLEKNDIIKSKATFNWLAARVDYWQNIKPGKYEIKKGTSLLTLIRMLRNGKQTPVKLVINKIRTKEELAHMVGNRFECDSAQMIAFLNNADSLQKFGADTTTALWIIIPDTYTYFWNTTPGLIYKKLYEGSRKFWTPERKQQATAQGLTPVQAYTLASIVEEETNANAEKGNIASVYMNRYNHGMPLQADPTIKFAMRDFGLKRIYDKYLFIQSPYNTYRNKGLPPGPICTPSKNTLNAVLTAPKTNYLYFVASSSFNGTHDFSATYEEHMQKAHAYQQALNQRQITNDEKAETK